MVPHNAPKKLCNVMKTIIPLLVIFGVCMYILFIIKLKILVLIKWSYKSLQPC